MNTAMVTAADVNPDDLNAFLKRFYPQTKCNFLHVHGDWWHGGQLNRWVLLVDNQIAGYCSLIPTRVLHHAQVVPAVWWVDLIIAPEFRGLGLQSLFDKKIQSLGALKLGFPNSLAAKIHLKHGWNVRHDLQAMLFPLRPLDVRQVRAGSGLRGRLLLLGAFVMLPGSWIIRRRLQCYHPKTARRVDNPSAETLADIFFRFVDKNMFTTYRDKDYIRHRFLNSPYRNELSFYMAGPQNAPTHFLIARHLKQDNGFVTRILDLFGNFGDLQNLKDLVLLVLRDADRLGSSQVTVLSSLPKLRTFLFQQGFFFRSVSHFCWMDNSALSAQEENLYWAIADSDNDELA